MPLLLVIFRKDLRRLWPGVLLCSLLLAMLSAIDNARADYFVTLEETVLNILLPLAWCGLLVQLVHQESPAAANPFWATRPYPWPALVGAKLLFALLFVHVPLLVANAAVLSLHHFSPWLHMPALLGLQLTVAVAVTLPSLALASVARTFTQAAGAALLLVAVVAGLRSYSRPFDLPWIPFDPDRLIVALGCLAVAAAAIFLLQYARRRTALARFIGLTAVLGAAALFIYLPPELTASLHTSSSSQASLSLRPAISSEREAPARFPFGVRTMGVPIKLSGLPGEHQFTTDLLSLELTGGQGFHWSQNPRDRLNPQPKPMQGNLWLREDHLGWLSIRMSKSAFETLKDHRVSIRGKVSLTEFSVAPPTTVPASSTQAREIAGVGRCTSLIVENTRNPYESEMLKVLCESPETMPRRVDLILRSTGAGGPWRHFLGDAAISLPYPRIAWLSPVHRHQTFFHISPRPLPVPSTYLVPRAALNGAQITFQPWREAARLIVPFAFSNLSLQETLVQE